MRLRTILSAAGVAVLTLAVASSAVARPLSRPLTAEQVACETDRLHWLFFSTMLLSSQLEGPWTLFASPRGPAGYDLLLLENQWPTPFEGEPLGEERMPEKHLAASLSFEHRSVSLDPERHLVPWARLVRDRAQSNLEASGGLLSVLAKFGANDLYLRVDLDRRALASGRARFAEDLGLTVSCGGELTDEDRFLFSVLRRILRFRSEAQFPFDAETGDNEVAIYRGEAPDEFVIAAHAVDGADPHPSQPLSFRLRLARDAQGRLTTGELELPSLPEWADEVVTDLFVVPPVRPGRDVWPEDGGGTVRLRVPEDFQAGPVTLDLEALLAGSTWNPPRF